MNAETWTALSGGVVGVVSAGVTAWGARSARRTKRQESRDDFLAITTQQGNAIERLEARVQRQETEAEKQRQRIGDQDEAIGWLLYRVRSLVSHIKKAGMEPPAAEPMSEQAARYIRNIDA
ncbi:hypothetical protein [Streptomyces sp. NPDC058202]|jgi:hypothetical protein|uniref:hypothetical protein n=1 Tax=Streptomyces sp. NPDC058202 TaxID=3346380 RepID=UPI0036E54D82